MKKLFTTIVVFLISQTVFACAGVYNSFTTSTSGLTVAYAAIIGVPAPGGYSLAWTLGDGAVSVAISGTHTYASAGTYIITLYIALQTGCTDTVTQSVTVPGSSSSSCAGVSNSFTSSSSGLTASFTNTSTDTAISSSSSTQWFFGDGSSDTSFSQSHTYMSSGSYSVKLIMTWYDSLTFLTCTDSVVNLVTVTSSSTTNQITGNLSTDTGTGNPSSPVFKVWLISYDSASSILSAVDSVNVIGSAYTGSYAFSNEPAGAYRVKAALTNGPTSGTAALPTYGYDSLYWQGAIVINYSGSGIDTGNNIYLLNGTVTNGPGFVGGNVSSGANKGTQTTGVPVASLIIFLENMSGKVLAYTATDASGNYHFANFPAGSYKIYPECMGYNTTPAVVTIGASQVSNINFIEHTISKTITPNSNVAVANVTENIASFNVFPNPCSGLFNITWSSNNALQNVHANVTDVVGHKIFETDLDMSNTKGYAHINLSNLTSGIYFINIKVDGINYTNKVVLQK
ncbi:MAG: PKD domain-containing protein [Flavipsychrobacter sp.]|nr:PKD domain-containing protein [Flavipsychrobacter sp.]